MCIMSNLMFHNPSIKTKLASLVVPGLLAVLIVTSISYWGFQRAQDRWHEYLNVVDAKQAQLLNMRTHMGYGNAIHNLKNYVLRGKQKYFDGYLANIEQLHQDITTYRDLGQLAPREKAALEKIGELADNYRRALFKAKALRETGAHAYNIDKAIKIDDTPYLAALDSLSTELQNVTATYKHELAGIFSQTILLLLLISGILLVGLSILSIKASRSVTQPIQRLHEYISQLESDGDLTHQVHVNGYEEIKMLGDAFNRMTQTLATSAARLSALNQIAAELTSTLSLDELLEQIMDHGIHLTGAMAACIAFYNQESGDFEGCVTQGLSDHFVKNIAFRPGGLADEAFSTGSCILSNDLLETKHKLSALTRDEGIRSFVCLPLTGHSQCLGVIYFYRHDQDMFQHDETDLLTTFATLAAGAIVNARLFRETLSLATFDGLTGLYNRRSYDDRLALEIKRSDRYNKSFAVALLDIDHFKNVNDTYGHPAGDVVLQQIAVILKKQTRDVDIVARYGGEEFVCLLTELDESHVRNVTERIRKAIADANFQLPNGNTIPVTVSFGVASFPHSAKSTEMLMTYVDQALYVAKHEGRNRVCFYHEMLKVRLEEDPSLITKLLNESLDNIQHIVTAIDAKATFLHDHSNLVAHHAGLLGQSLNLSANDQETLRLAAMLHDVGIIAIPDAILNNKDTLSPEQQEIMSQHPVVGAQILEQVSLLHEVALLVRHHHELYDGGGYPDGLRGEQIPCLARILTIADAYAAMTTNWFGRKPKTPEEAKAELLDCAGGQFDEALVRTFLQALEQTSFDEQPSAYGRTA